MATPLAANLVFILADDLAVADMERLPELTGLLSREGTTFDQSFVSLSLCCPSRATTLRGQYAHNTTIFGNRPPDGGYQAFRERGLESSTIATWLQGAGYRTGLFGKYLNGYPDRSDPSAVPPGWDDWVVPSSRDPYAGFDYTLNDNGTSVAHGRGDDDHLTDVIAQEAAAFVRESHAAKRPFFAFVAPMAPHSPATPPRRYEGAYPDAATTRGAAFNEADVQDKSSWMRSLPLLDAPYLARLDRLVGKRLASMLAVRDLVEKLVTTLRETGHLDDTYVVFTSDNGFHLGQHRLPEGKDTWYDEDLRVPLYVRGPGVRVGARRAELVVNTDLAATFADMAGLALPAQCDGRSWLPLAKGTDTPWRRGVLLEHRGATTGAAVPAGTRDDAEPSTLEPADGDAGNPKGGRGGGRRTGPAMPPFVGVRSDRYAYVRLEGGERELYDLAADPHELTNLAAKAGTRLLSALDAWVDAMRSCKGAECRSAEERNPTGE